MTEPAGSVAAWPRPTSTRATWFACAPAPATRSRSCTRLGRLVVERLDGKPQGPVVLRDVVEVFKSAGRPAAAPGTELLKPSAQLKLLP
jgi:hypothetical protein